MTQSATDGIAPEVAKKLAELRDPFPAEYIAYRPQPWCRACSQSQGKHCKDHKMIRCPKCKQRITEAHMDLSYVGHAETTDRLLKSDPTWTWKPLAREIDSQALAAAAASGNPEAIKAVIEASPPKLDQYGGLWIELTVLGVTKPGYGDAQGKPPGPNAIKEIIGDAIRNASMRFGVGIDLWSKSDMAEVEAAAMAERDGQDPAGGQAPPATAGTGTPSGHRVGASNGHALPARNGNGQAAQQARPPQYPQETQEWFAWMRSQIDAAADGSTLDDLAAIAAEGCTQHRCGEVLTQMTAHIDQRLAALAAPVDPGTLRTMHIRLSGRKVKSGDDHKVAACRIVGRPEVVESTQELTLSEALAVIKACKTELAGRDLLTGEMVPADVGQPYEPEPGAAGSQWADPAEVA